MRRYGGGGQSYRGLPAPARILDTRPGYATADGQFAGLGLRPGGSVLELQVTNRAGVPAGASSVALNVTVTGPESSGYVTVYPCGQPPPLASSLNFVAGQTVPNTVVSKLSADGKACLYASAATHLVADAGGYFPTSTRRHDWPRTGAAGRHPAGLAYRRRALRRGRPAAGRTCWRSPLVAAPECRPGPVQWC